MKSKSMVSLTVVVITIVGLHCQLSYGRVPANNRAAITAAAPRTSHVSTAIDKGRGTINMGNATSMMPVTDPNQVAKAQRYVETQKSNQIFLQEIRNFFAPYENNHVAPYVAWALQELQQEIIAVFKNPAAVGMPGSSSNICTAYLISRQTQPKELSFY